MFVSQGTGTREQIMQALFTLVSNAYPWATTSRRLKLWGDVPVEDRPALFQFEGGPAPYKYSMDIYPIRVIPVKLFCYINLT